MENQIIRKKYYVRAIIPALIASSLLVSFGLMKKKQTSTVVFLGVLGLPIGYLIGNAGKW